ncbi:hypothetical protein B7P43_G10897 [Cryptotermes secundus]|uniref:C2HC/C3H-type domain-containing protein n=1 Tax=Cryptotermes secundus TaxID=105785 RepID=A0A2J7QS04_9NEOP|nr:uncharacterized protein LOC111865786 isoform X2 [Cryptotermes secundus]PNF31353.1 hypothetical protein B7P43_G10897 [Cryptotermes secundus]
MATMMDAPVSVTSSPSGRSRLTQMQARFQQKQMQEKEQKLLRLYENQTQRAFQRVGRSSAGSSSSSVSSTSSSLGAGKVRQLFQERRNQNGTKAGWSGPTGWDRSYPLEPLESTTTTTTKQRLQASKSTGNLKGGRGTSLERNYSNSIATSNQQQAKNQIRRSKSQVRTNNYVVPDLGGNFRQLSLSQQKIYGYEDYEDIVDYPRNHKPRIYQDEQNNRIRLEREHREAEIFHKHQIYDKYEDEGYVIDHEEPPFQQLDDDVDDFNDSSHVFQKLPNVGGRLVMESKMNNNNNNGDRYKTYNATQNGIRDARRNMSDREENGRRMTPPAAKELTQRRRDPQDAVPVAKPRATMATKKPHAKVTSPTSPAPPKSGSTPKKPEPVNQKASPDTESTSLWGKKKVPANGQIPQQASQRSPSTQSSHGKAAQGSQAAEDRIECRICGRQFALDRIAKHQEICSKAIKKKRRTYDPVKHRVQGTEAEAFLKMGQPKAAPPVKKSNWRQKHEDFINTIRAAKQVKTHLAQGGKLSDLPPPPSSDYSDYIQCPHCSRRFNQHAAERHIPKCANYVFNKPKQPQGGKGIPSKGVVPRKR